MFRIALIIMLYLTTVVLSVTINIISEPPDAHVFIDGQYFGKSSITAELSKGEHEIILKKVGFETFKTRFNVVEPRNFFTNLKPDPRLIRGLKIPIKIYQCIFSSNIPVCKFRGTDILDYFVDRLRENYFEAIKITLSMDLVNLTEYLDSSTLSKLRKEYPFSRYVVLGIATWIETLSEEIAKPKAQLGIYDLYDGKRLETIQVNEGGKFRSISKAFEYIFTLSYPRIANFFISKSISRNIKIPITNLDLSKYPKVSIDFNIQIDDKYYTTLKKGNIVISNAEGRILDIQDFRRNVLTPFKTVILVDSTLSTIEESDLIKKISTTLLKQLPGEFALVIMGNGSKNYYSIFPGSPKFTNNIELLIEKIELLKNNGLTTLYNAIISAVELLKSVEGYKSIILITDGKDSTDKTLLSLSKRKNLNDVVEELKDTRIRIISLSVGKDTNDETLRILADKTGGEFIKIENENDVSKIINLYLNEKEIVNYTLTCDVTSSKYLTVTLHMPPLFGWSTVNISKILIEELIYQDKIDELLELLVNNKIPLSDVEKLTLLSQLLLRTYLTNRTKVENLLKKYDNLEHLLKFESDLKDFADIQLSKSFFELMNGNEKRALKYLGDAVNNNLRYIWLNEIELFLKIINGLKLGYEILENYDIYEIKLSADLLRMLHFYKTSDRIISMIKPFYMVKSQEPPDSDFVAVHSYRLYTNLFRISNDDIEKGKFEEKLEELISYGKFQEALEKIESKIMVYPWNMHLIRLENILLTENHSFSEALKKIEKLLSIDPYNKDLILLKFETLIKKGDRKSAKSLLESALCIIPEDLMLRLYYSRLKQISIPNYLKYYDSKEAPVIIFEYTKKYVPKDRKQVFALIIIRDNALVKSVDIEGESIKFPIGFHLSGYIRKFNLNEFENRFMVKAIDICGNTSKRELKFFVDSRIPKLYLDDIIFTNRRFFALDIKSEDNVGLKKLIINGKEYNISGKIHTLTYNVDIDRDGTLYLEVVDEAGNKLKKNIKFIYDDVKPEIHLINTVPQTTFEEMIPIIFEVKDNLGIDKVKINDEILSPLSNGKYFKKLRLRIGKNVFKISAVDKAGNNSEIKFYIFRINPVESPANLTQLDSKGNFIIISWEDRSIAEDGYEVWRNSGHGWKKIAILPKDTERFEDKDAPLNVHNSYKVRSFKGKDIFSDWSKIIITNRNPTPPVLIEPRNGSTVSLPTNLSWKAWDPDGDKLYFDIFLGDRSKNITVGFVMDYSSAMEDDDIRLMEKAVKKFVRLMEPEDKGFVVKFSGIYAIYPSDGFARKDYLSYLTIAPFRGRGGSLALYDAIFAALNRISKDSSDNLKILIVLSSEEDNMSTHNLTGCLNIASRLNVKIYTISCNKINMKMMKEMALKTGGMYYQCIHNEEALLRIYEQLAHSVKLPKFAENITKGSCTVSNLKSGKQYYWKVVAIDEHGGTAESIVQNFKVK